MQTNALIALVISFAIILSPSCTTSKPSKEFTADKEFLSLNFVDNQKFEYLYYKLGADGITDDYCKGFYTKSGKNITLVPDSLKNKEFEVNIASTYIAGLTSKRIKIETNISGDYLNNYKICLISNSFKISFNGVNVDTTLDSSMFKRFYIELFIADNYLTGTPIPKYKSIITKEINLDSTSNSFKINVPITRQTFYYKNSAPIVIRDLGKYWMLMEDAKKIPKGKVFLP